VRYICGVYHPSNLILGSDVVQRYAMLGWLMQMLKVRAHGLRKQWLIDSMLTYVAKLNRGLVALSRANKRTTLS